ncbi:hypothetical protein BKA80DRAFT_253365 [Phyllosticta citrichinensis]
MASAFVAPSALPGGGGDPPRQPNNNNNNNNNNTGHRVEKSGESNMGQHAEKMPRDFSVLQQDHITLQQQYDEERELTNMQVDREGWEDNTRSLILHEREERTASFHLNEMVQRYQQQIQELQRQLQERNQQDGHQKG